MKKKILKLIQTLVFIGLGVFFIFYFWGKLNAEQQEKIIDNFAKANYFWVGIALLAGILSHILRSARWNLLIETFNTAPSLKKTFWAVMAGYLANLAMPRLGEITRCALLSKQSKVPFDKLLGSVMAERAFDFFFYLMLFFASITIFYSKLKSYIDNRLMKGFNEKMNAFSSWKMLLILGTLATAFLIFIWILNRFRNKPFIQKVRQILKNLFNGLISIFKLKRSGLFFVYTFFIWILYWLIVYLMYFSLPSTAGLSMESAFMVLVFGTIGIILIQGGIGIYPVIVSEVLLIYGADITDGFSIGWLSWSVQTLMILLLGMIAFVMVNFQTKKKDGLQNADR